MRRSPAFLLLEALIASALVAVLAVSLLTLQTASVRQLKRAEARRALAEAADRLLWDWRERDVAVIEAGEGTTEAGFAWRRISRVVEIERGVRAHEVTLTLTPAREEVGAFIVSWWVNARREDHP
ncbi:MAG: hypothetical protein KDA32_08005 [Phycisphaerales bacterium]|nr:hypothetical protein [Phycisphaerales bacterium]